MRLIPYLVNLKESTNVSSEVYPQKLRTELSYKGNYVKDIEYIEYLNENLFKKGTHLGNDLWTIYTHYSVDNKFYQLGFKIEVDENESLDDFILSFKSYINSNEERYTLRYLPNEDIFIDTNFYKLNRKIKTKNIFDTAGFIILEVENIKNNTKEEIPIRVLPSSIDYEDYIEMINDLISIREDIVISEGSKVGIGNHWERRKNNYNECIDKIYNHIVQIDKNPKGKLSMENVKIPYNKIKNIKPKTIIEKSLYPYKDKYVTSIGKEDFNIYENQIIKYSLIQIRDKIEKYKKDYLKNIQYNKQYLEDVSEKLSDIFEDNIENKLKHYKNKIEYNTIKIENLIYENKQDVFEYDKDCIRVIFELDSYLYSLSIDDICIDLKYNAKSEYELVFESSYYNDENYNNMYDVETDRKTYKYLHNGDKKFTQAQFKTRKVNLLYRSKDIRNIKFLYDKLSDRELHKISFDIIAKRQNYSYSDPLIKSDTINNPNIKPSMLIECVEIRSINGETVPNYDENEIKLFMEANVLGLNSVDIYEKIGFIKSLEHKIEINNMNEQNFINDKSLDITLEKIDKLLSLDFIKNIKCKRDILKPTQIFINDFSYNKVFRELKILNKKVRFLDNISPEMLFLKTTSNIYEYWCLFKIVNVLINDLGWTLNNKSDVLKSIDKFLKHSSNFNKQSITLDLEHKLKNGSTLHLDLIYEGKVYYNDSQYKTPDFQFRFKRDEEYSPWLYSSKSLQKIVYLDAKYRNYDEQGKDKFFDDINDVSIDKYYNTFINTVNKSDVSFIVHSDKNNKYNCFGGNHIVDNGKLKEIVSKYEDEKYENINNHKFGSFFLLPYNSFNINNFLRMILEYHLGLYRMCWTCGEIHDINVEEKRTKGGKQKYHFTCNTCEEFWVKNHCAKKGENHTLVKHYDNYHSINKGKKDPWYVICPVCFDGMEEKEEYENNLKFSIVNKLDFEDDIPF